ncbi:PGAP1-domain-containing protein [Epithele typhae]|uniref:PGAP1-domain-containing protein n=1 Tax=Epithele typhae TaxID=378194 RepID=UPI0020088597|nr:PGAP1-domain-containing protein [Epithele typhae]KAH9943147.1 PGAP1-domain-containing protein [Epithele typhae]
MSRLLVALSVFTLAALAAFYYAVLDTYSSLSPQGCRMSWMWPGYILQNKFDPSWTPLARRYNLWLYREGNDFESHELHGAPVLFIPGNAGSSHQVRSIASSAAHQYFSAPSHVADEFAGEGYKGLDFFAVEFNEDLSAFHGPTIDTQIAYASKAIDYILSQYPTGTSIIVMGHSMGGVVATALLPNPNISAVITMSTPHTLPPVRFDRRIDHIYAENHKRLVSDPTPILSLCGGAPDLMIPSEACMLLPSVIHFPSSLYRRTVFTSALEGCWTGVGHLAMVWCHQVRWRVARAALDIAAAGTLEGRTAALDKWLKDDQILLVRQPEESTTYILSLPPAHDGRSSATFVLYASRGSIASIAPQKPLPFHVNVHHCRNPSPCSPLAPKLLKLLPSPIAGSPFPVPDEGSDESEGIVLFEADLSLAEGGDVMVTLEEGNKHGWVLGGFVNGEPENANVGLLSLLFSSWEVDVPAGIRTHINIPGLLSNSLLVYSITPVVDQSSDCSSNTVLLPLLEHSSSPVETHYYPLAPGFGRPLLLHSHAAAPYISSVNPRGHTLTIYSSGECAVEKLTIRVDWWATIGRWGTRYGPAAACWAVGIAIILVWDTWGIAERGAAIPDVNGSLEFFARRRLPALSALSLLVSLLPLRVGLWLGNAGEPSFALLSTLLLPISFGLVCIMWWLLRIILWPFQRILRVFPRRREDLALRRRTSALLSMAIIFLLIFVVVPWQVAFLGCWLIHLYTCASVLSEVYSTPPASSAQSSPDAIPLVSMSSESQELDQPSAEARGIPPADLPWNQQVNAHLHILLLMTWLLPLVAPVLAVWVRTLVTAGLTTPFDGDHNFLYVAPFLVLVEVLGSGAAGTGIKVLFTGHIHERISPRWGMAAVALVAFFAASVAMGWAVIQRIGPVYWRGSV